MQEVVARSLVELGLLRLAAQSGITLKMAPASFDSKVMLKVVISHDSPRI